MQMSKEEQMSYDRHLEDIMVQNDCIASAIKEGRAEGRAEGVQQTNRANAKSMKTLGVDIGIISQVTGLTEEEIKEL